jgi:hypothetical protein
MESNQSDINNGGDKHQHQQLRGTTRKRTFDELANDVDPADKDQQQEPEICSKKNSKCGNGNANGLDREVCIIKRKIIHVGEFISKR